MISIPCSPRYTWMSQPKHSRCRLAAKVNYSLLLFAKVVRLFGVQIGSIWIRLDKQYITLSSTQVSQVSLNIRNHMLEITTYNLQVRSIPEIFNLQGTAEIHIAFLGPFLNQSFACLMGQTFICLRFSSNRRQRPPIFGEQIHPAEMEMICNY